jgi:hypothetical protein
VRPPSQTAAASALGRIPTNMTDQVTKDTLFKTRLSRAETKSASTDRNAWTIIEDETERRNAKTKRLRQLRLAREALDPEPRGKAVRKQRLKSNRSN